MSTIKDLIWDGTKYSEVDAGAVNGKNSEELLRLVTETTDGIMSRSDKAKLNRISQNAQKNSEITKAEIEEKLTGNIETHTHSFIEKQQYSLPVEIQYVEPIKIPVDAIKGRFIGSLKGNTNIDTLECVGPTKISFTGSNIFEFYDMNNSIEKGVYESPPQNYIVGDILYCPSGTTNVIPRGKFLKLKKNTTYKMKYENTGVKANIIMIYEADGLTFSNKETKLIANSTSNNFDFTTTSNSDMYFLAFGIAGVTDTAAPAKFKNIMISEGTFDLDYESFKITDIYCPANLNKINEICDEFSFYGKLSKRIGEYIIKPEDILSMPSLTPSMRGAITSIDFLPDADKISWDNTKLSNTVLIEGVKEKIFSGFISNIGSFYTKASGILTFVFAYETTLEQARETLAGKKIKYILKDEVITQYNVNNCISESNGTLEVNHIIEDVTFYNEGIILGDIIINSIVKVYKIDKSNGSKTDITKTCSLNQAKNGFTSASQLSYKDLIHFILQIDCHIMPTVEYSYPLNLAGCVTGNTDSIKQIDDEISNLKIRTTGFNEAIETLTDYLGYMPIDGGNFDGNEPNGVNIDGGTY